MAAFGAIQALKYAFHFALFSVFAFVIAAWPRRAALQARLREPGLRARPGVWLALNFGVFFLLVAYGASRALVGAETGTEYFLVAWAVGAVAMLACLARAFLPFTAWRRLIWSGRTEIVVACAAALFAGAMAVASQESWRVLSDVTMTLVSLMLQLTAPSVVVDYPSRIITLGDYTVLIDNACSGYEGIGLVLTFVALYLYVFRAVLRFPHALLLLPIAGALIWILNAARIAVLVTIGARWSPELASGTFHTQAGWIVFLGISAAVLLWAHHIAFFRRVARTPATAPIAGEDRSALALAAALILPFMALMLARIVVATLGPISIWMIAVEVAAAGTVLWVFRRQYAPLLQKVEPASILIGVAVGAVWIMTAPRATEPSELGAWLNTLPPASEIGWLTLRVLIAVLIVPIVEELAFRGYLHRALAGRRFETTPQGQFTWTALIVSSVLFGALHSRWLSGLLAGAVFAALMYRTNRISDPIAAHASANAVIAAWAIGAGQYDLL